MKAAYHLCVAAAAGASAASAACKSFVCNFCYTLLLLMLLWQTTFLSLPI